jgi:S1-C subfamily serine protease
VEHTGRAYLGIAARDAGQGTQITPFQPFQPQPSQPSAQGVVVQSVGAGSPAAKAGLQAGDVIVSLAGLPVQNMDTLYAILADQHVGQKVTIVVKRANATTGATTTLTRRVTLGELPANPQ